MYQGGVSLIIRVRNELDKLTYLLGMIEAQEFDNLVELIIVDTESTDGSRELAEAHGAKIVSLKQKDFTYPRSINAGLEVAKCEVVVATVAHAQPMSKNWLRDGVNHFVNPKVAGVYSPVLPLENASDAELAFYTPQYDGAAKRGAYVARPGAMGVFGLTNVAMRRSLWEEHPFDDAYEAGGEDGEWAGWATSKGYEIICDSRFAVRHSHGLDAEGLKLQIAYWAMLGEPRKFDDPLMSELRKKLQAARLAAS